MLILQWMHDAVLSPFIDYAFMRRALIGCLALSIGATPIGVFMILRRMSLTGDAMAHAILPGAAVGYLLSGLSLVSMTIGGLVAGMTVAVLSGFITRNTHLKEDASLAAFYLISLAFGVLIISTRGGSVDLLHVLFGTVLALNNDALLLMLSIASISMVTLSLIYRALIMECLDPLFLRSVSNSGAWAHYSFIALVVLNLVGGFHALGTLMVVGIMILPAAAAHFWSSQVSMMICLSVALAIISSFVGLLVSYHANLPSGPAIILSAGSCYLISLLLGTKNSWRAKYLQDY
jgi:zinc/manganese transport system permease protein